MKIRRLLGTMILIAAMLACDTGIGLPGEEVRIAYTIIATVSVTPSSGSGSFTMEVAYLVARGEDRADSIQCYYVSPEGNTMAIGDFIPERPDLSNPSQGNNSLKFSVTQPGFYTAGCHTGENNSQMTTTFTVVADGTVPTEPPVAPPPQEPPKPTFTLTGGTITYDEASEQLSPHKNDHGYYPSQHHKWCNPALSIDANGNISGICSSTGDKVPPGAYGDWNGNATIQGTVTGKMVPGGSFTFREELIETYSPGTSFEYTRKAVIEGTGSFVSPTRATGTATLDADCRTVDNYANICGDYPSLSDHFTGSINWEFNGTGVTSDADSVSSLRPQEKGRMVPVYDIASAIPLRGLVSDMRKKYLDLIFKA